MVKDERIYVRISPEEKKRLQRTCAQFGHKSLSAFIRKMALDGMIVHLQIPELKEVIRLLRNCSSNLNQIAKRVNATGRIYSPELEQVLRQQEELWQVVNELLAKLAGIR